MLGSLKKSSAVKRCLVSVNNLAVSSRCTPELPLPLLLDMCQGSPVFDAPSGHFGGLDMSLWAGSNRGVQILVDCHCAISQRLQKPDDMCFSSACLCVFYQSISKNARFLVMNVHWKQVSSSPKADWDADGHQEC